ncbi:MAG: hypothetical protein O2955_08955 [Planctomycetota bacterium]|nr:hypothetical protein [Planctomycetota bacterium]MDA1212635.1 hypothetical protein [Planctomycetota bacterium]
MNLRKTFKWTAIFLFLLVMAGGGVGYWIWMQGDELLKATIITQANTIIPEGDFSLGTAHFDLSRRIRLYDVELKPKTDQPPMVSIPEIILKIDNDLLAREQRVLVHKVTIERPTFEFVLRRDGTWNWQSIWPLPASDNSLPEFEIQRATITLHWEPASGVQHTSVTLQNVDLHLIPSGHREFHVTAAGDVNFSGKVNLEGKLNLERSSWTVIGKWKGLKAGPELGQLISTIFPEFDEKLQRLLAENSETFSDAAYDDELDNEQQELDESKNAVDAVSDVTFSENHPEASSAQTPVTSPSIDSVRQTADSGDPERVSTLWTGDTRQAEGISDSSASARSISQRLWQGLSASLDVGFELSSSSSYKVPRARVSVQVQEGRLAHPDLPFDLNELFGTVIWDNNSLEIRDMQATHGATQFLLHGKRAQTAESFSSLWHVQMTGLVLDQQFRNVLRGGVARLFDAIQPRGSVDLVFDLKENHPTDVTSIQRASIEENREVHVALDEVSADEAASLDSILPIGREIDTASRAPETPLSSTPRRWEVENLLFTVKDASMMLAKFPYPIHHISGQIQQQDRELSVSLQGMAGKRPVVAKGMIQNPGIDAGVDMTIVVDKISIDETLIAALPSDIQPTVNDLRLTGTMDGAVHVVRPGGRHRLWSIFVDADIADGTIQFQKFPLRMIDLNGHLIYSNSNHRWSVTDLHARRGKGIIEGEAHFRSPAHSHELSLNLKAEQLPLDGNLLQALPEGLRRAWEFMDLRGTADISAIVLWNPDEAVDITLPTVEVTNGSLRLESFKYPLEQVRSKFRYNDGLVHFHSFSGRHDDTLVRAKGMMRLMDDGGWNLHLEPFFVDDLLPGRSFRRALSPALKQAVDSVDLQQPLSMSGKVTFEQKVEDETLLPMSAAFDVETILTGNAIDVGVEVKNIYGRVTTSGTWDGYQCKMIGTIDLESLLAHGYYITQVQGPFRFDNQRLMLGSPQMVNSIRSSLPQTPVPSEERIAGRTIGGVITLDSVIEAGTPPPQETSGNYNAVLTLSEGRLETYAQQYLTDKKNLRGVINAWLSLNGTNSDSESLRGFGQLRISPAAIYELPVMIRTLQLLRPGPLEKAAFQYVFLEFNLINQRVEFNKIDLVGDAVSLRGRGTATLDGKLDLDFYSMMSQNQMSIPILSAIVGEATKGWVGVKVTGEVGNPDAEIQPLKNLDTALKTFLGAFDPGKSYPSPRLTTPNRPVPRTNVFPGLPTFAPPFQPRQSPPQSASPNRPTSTR